MDRRPIFPNLARIVCRLALVALTFALSGTREISADIQLPKIFSDHMVLQRSERIRIWGTSDPKEALTIKLGDQSATTEADDNGRWSVFIAAPKTNGPFKLDVKGADTGVVIDDVLIGEVWICSGQNNMAMSLLDSQNGKAEVDAARNPMLRLVRVPTTTMEKPSSDLEQVIAWTESNQDSAKDFSALAYHFGGKLQSELNTPVGIIQLSADDSTCEAWMPRSAIEKIPEAKPLLELNGGDGTNVNRPANLFNGMVAPLMRFTVAGVVWYQGESNVGRSALYRQLFPELIKSWRRKFENDTLPFLYVQLSPFRYEERAKTALPEIWDIQRRTQSVQNTGMIVTTDLGDPQTLVPKQKKEVAWRLANLALAKVYQKPDRQWSGPIYQSMKIEGKKIRLTFSEIAGGLKTKSGEKLIGFSICDNSREFVPAEAIIDGDTIVVSAENVETPIGVRFGWTDTASPNLLNGADLPASPFQTAEFNLPSKN